MLANIQKLITLCLAVCAAAWFAAFQNNKPGLAWFGAIVIIFGYTVILAAEFVLLKLLSQGDKVDQPTWNEMLSAWWGEVRTTPIIFCWRQPFQSNAIPDVLGPKEMVSGRRGVVFIHGLFCNRGFWTPWYQRLQAKGHAFVGLSMVPVLGSIDQYVPQIDQAVTRVTAATGLTPLIICHSMGGLAVRAWLKNSQGESRAFHVVTIGTPHRGTWLARFGQAQNTRQMRLKSSWHTDLDTDMPVGRHQLFTCWYSSSDNIVFPCATATLPEADNRIIRGFAHVEMAFAPQVMRATLALLDKNEA